MHTIVDRLAAIDTARHRLLIIAVGIAAAAIVDNKLG
jgi:hypothetical protein